MLEPIQRECEIEVLNLTVAPINGVSVLIKFTTYSEKFIKYVSEKDMKCSLEKMGYKVEKVKK